jgi:hypothetical protein
MAVVTTAIAMNAPRGPQIGRIMWPAPGGEDGDASRSFGNRVRFTPYRIAKRNKVGAGCNQRRNRLK